MASPRPSPALAATSPASSHSSLPSTSTADPNSSQQNISSAATGAPPPVSTRRNRAALRDYYNLSTSQPQTQARSPTASPTPTQSRNPLSPEVTTPRSPANPLDNPSLTPAHYTNTLLSTSTLPELLKAQSGLVGEVRGLDGERKALVYDNYSKLIAATRTIQKMRESMSGPLAGSGMLLPGVGHVVSVGTEVAEGRRRERERVDAQENRTGGLSEEEEAMRKRKETVRWVLQAPERVEGLVRSGKREEAERDWEEVSRLLEGWEGVDGVEEVRERGMIALAG